MRRLPVLLLPLLLALPAAAQVVLDRAPAEGPAVDSCGRRVGFIGRPLLQLQPFLSTEGFPSSTALTSADVPGLLASSPDVIFVVRGGADSARAHAASLDAWVRAGGLLVTEFTATQVLYEPGPLHYFFGALVDDFWVPSGTACGGNAIRVERPGQPLTEGLPDAWGCSGDPMGTLQVFAGVDGRMCVALSVIGSDRDRDGRDDPLLGTRPVGAGAVAAFFSDFANFQPLEDPRSCPSGPASAECLRSVLDEQVLLNVLCHADEPLSCEDGCGDCQALRDTLASAEIDVEGVRRSMAAKVRAACASIDRGRLLPAGNQLCALLREIAAQENRHLSASSAAELRACIEALAAAEGLSLGVPAGGCSGRPALGGSGGPRPRR